ncbi:MAG: FtsX-like permease family protein, partial [Candidatus Bathyarchaeia archaeon]
HLKTGTANLTASIRAVENVEKYLKFYAARLNGTYARENFETSVGELLARTAKITLNATLTLSIAEKTVEVRVVGVHRTQSQLDGEIIIPLNALKELIASSKLSIIEFTLKQGANRTSALIILAERLPASVRIIKVQQPGAFMQNLNMQTIAFLNVLSIAVYTVIAVASYVITAHLTAESTYELAMLRALGARKRQILTMIMGYVTLIAVLASILGAALGLTAAQIASTLLKWLQPTVEIAPFLQPEQILKALALTLASAFLGSMILAGRVARLSCMEQPL